MTRYVVALLHGVTFYSHLHKLSFWPSDFILRLCHWGQRSPAPPPNTHTHTHTLPEMPGSCQSPANHNVMHISYRQRLGDGLFSLHYSYKVFFLCVLVEVKKNSAILLQVEIDDCLIFPLPQAFPCGIRHHCCKENISRLATDLIYALRKGLSKRRVEQTVNRSVRVFYVGFFHSPSSTSLPSPSARFAVKAAIRGKNASSCLGEAMPDALPFVPLCSLHFSRKIQPRGRPPGKVYRE